MCLLLKVYRLCQAARKNASFSVRIYRIRTQCRLIAQKSSGTLEITRVLVSPRSVAFVVKGLMCDWP